MVGAAVKFVILNGTLPLVIHFWKGRSYRNTSYLTLNKTYSFSCLSLETLQVEKVAVLILIIHSWKHFLLTGASLRLRTSLWVNRGGYEVEHFVFSLAIHCWKGNKNWNSMVIISDQHTTAYFKRWPFFPNKKIFLLFKVTNFNQVDFLLGQMIDSKSQLCVQGQRSWFKISSCSDLRVFPLNFNFLSNNV